MKENSTTLVKNTGLAMSALVLSMAQPAFAQSMPSKLPDNPLVTYKIGQAGDVNAALLKTTKKRPQATMSLKEQVRLLRLENTQLEAQVENLAQQIEILKTATKTATNTQTQIIPGQPEDQTVVQAKKPVSITQASVVSSKNIDTSIAAKNLDHHTQVIHTLTKEPSPDAQQAVAPYQHHVVYIFKSRSAQQQMWSTLAKAGETDRWQGENTDQSRYFIYVGAFQERQAAQERALYIQDKTGVEPLVYTQKD